MVDQEKIHKKSLSNDPEERLIASKQLSNIFSSLPDKQQAWEDLHRLAYDKDGYVRSNSAEALGFVFSHLTDKQQAWNDLHSLTNDKHDYVRLSATSALGSAFSQVPDKEQAWNDLHRLANDEDSWVREMVAQTLGSAFSHMPYKQQAWNDLNKLTIDEDNLVRNCAAKGICSAFSQMPDKQQVWNDLHRMTNHEESNVRYKAAKVLVSAFSQVLNKQQVWNDLHRLTNDEDSYVRREAAHAIGSAFSEIPDKQYAWEDLIRLANDEDSDVNAYAFHSLGRISIFKATQANKEEDYREELEKAIYFFEIVSHDYYYDMVNPSKFCLPFYCSFHAIIFKKHNAKKAVKKYIEEAKDAIGTSKSKKILIEAIENLAKALYEVQNLKNLDLHSMKVKLNFYRKYCDHAVELMRDIDEGAPFATEVLIKGLPMLDRNLKELLEEIQKKARTTYEESIGTDVEETALAVCKEVHKWEIGSQEEMTENIEDLIIVLRSHFPNIPNNKRIFEKIEKIKYEPDLSKSLEHLKFIISVMPKGQVISMTQCVNITNNQQSQIQIGSINQLSGNTEEEHKMSKIKVLFLASNPKATKQLALDEEIREITQKIRASDYRDSIDLTSAWAVRPDDLLQMLNQHKPQIVHFSGHGSESEEIILTSASGESKTVSSRALKALFTTLKDNIKVVVLNCCYSKEQAKAITEVIDCAVGMSHDIGDKAAITFAASFYRGIGFGRSVKEAFDQGIVALLLEDMPEENTPELLVKDGVDPSQVIPLSLVGSVEKFRP